MELPFEAAARALASAVEVLIRAVAVPQPARAEANGGEVPPATAAGLRELRVEAGEVRRREIAAGVPSPGTRMHGRRGRSGVRHRWNMKTCRK